MMIESTYYALRKSYKSTRLWKHMALVFTYSSIVLFAILFLTQNLNASNMALGFVGVTVATIYNTLTMLMDAYLNK